MREAALTEAEEWLASDKWTAADLDGKTVQFRVRVKTLGPVEGTGKFLVLQRGSSQLKIKIESRHRKDAPNSYCFLFVRQQDAALIEKLPVGSKTDFSLIDPALKR